MKYDISEIEKLYPNWYNKESDLSHGDQKWIWENIPLPEEDEVKLKELGTSVSVTGNVNGTYKRQENFKQNLNKHQAIEKLKGCNYRTPPKEIAFYLESLFGIWEEKPKHWLFIAQLHTPKTINSVIRQMIKQHQRGDKTFETPGAYFTSIIKNKPKRKTFRSTNGTRKQQSP